MNRLALLAFAGLSALALAGCQKEEAPGQTAAETAAATSNPAEAISEAATKLKQGDLLAVVQMSVPPDHYERIKANWKRDMAADPVTDEERAEFAETMKRLTADDAEAQIYAELEPELAKFETEMAAQMPLMIGMGTGFAMQAVQNHETMTDAQKQQAREVINALATWLQGVKFADRDLARKAIAEAVQTARALDLESLDEARALEFEAAMAKGGVAFQGLKDVLKLYGFDLDQSLSSVKTQILSQEGDAAMVKVDYSILGQPMSFETAMVRIDGRWYGKDTIEQLRKELEAPAEPATDDTDPAEAEVAPAQG